MVNIFSFYNYRYILKKRFDRGSYGEVWVAFHWNYLQQRNDSNKTSQFYTTHLGSENGSTTQTNFTSGPLDADMFILKRIMVNQFHFFLIFMFAQIMKCHKMKTGRKGERSIPKRFTGEVFW